MSKVLGVLQKNACAQVCYLLPLFDGGSVDPELSLLNLIPTGDDGLCLARVSGGDIGLLGARWRGGGEGICPGDSLVNAESGDTGMSRALLNLGGDGMSVGDGEDGISGLPRRRMGRSIGERGFFLWRSREGLDDESESDEDDEDEDLGTLIRVLDGDELSELEEELCDLRNGGEGCLSLVFCMGKGGGEGDSSPEEGDETGDGASFLVLCSTGGESDMGIGVTDLCLPPGGGDIDSSL